MQHPTGEVVGGIPDIDPKTATPLLKKYFGRLPKAPGKVPILNDAHRRALAEAVEAGPIPAAHGVVRWRLVDLAQWVWDEFGLSITKQTLSREMRSLGFRKLSARPRHHGQKEHAIADFKKASQASWQR